jgi:hypothetical protein
MMAAHQLVDEPLDPAEEPMPAAAFRIIERAHQLCDHPAAGELSAEVGLEDRARAIFEELLPTTVGEGCLVELGDDETDEVKPLVPDWKQAAADAWDAKGWKDAAADYRTKVCR